MPEIGQKKAFHAKSVWKVKATPTDVLEHLPSRFDAKSRELVNGTSDISTLKQQNYTYLNYINPTAGAFAGYWQASNPGWHASVRIRSPYIIISGQGSMQLRLVLLRTEPIQT